MTTLNTDVVRIGVPNRGRLHYCCLEVIDKAFGTVDFKPRKLILNTQNDALQIVCVRSTDIPKLLATGLLHLGITGNDYVLEARSDAVELMDFEICPGDLSVLVAEDDPAQSLADLPTDVVVASQYPVAAQFFLEKRLPQFSLRPIDGAAEVYPVLGLCRAIVDVVASGETARSNQVRVIETLMETSARLYRSTHVPEHLLPQLNVVHERLQASQQYIAELMGK